MSSPEIQLYRIIFTSDILISRIKIREGAGRVNVCLISILVWLSSAVGSVMDSHSRYRGSNHC